MKKFITRSITIGISLILFLFILCSCFSDEFIRHAFFAMDTYIVLDARVGDTTLLAKAQDIVYSDEMLFSRTSSKGLIHELNEVGGLSGESEVASVTALALEISKNTDGAFNPCMGGLSDLWNIKNENPRIPEREEISELLSAIDTSNVSIYEDTVTVNGNTKIDLGGIAKGYSAEKVTEFLKENGVTDALISFGGSISCMGSYKNGEKWKIGIKNPFETSEIIGTLSVTDCYIAVSGAYERYFEKDGKRYHHILDPKTGYPAESDIESVAVISKNGAVADALSTALFVMGSKKATEFYDSGIYDFEFVIIKTDGIIITSRGIWDVFTLNEKATR